MCVLFCFWFLLFPPTGCSRADTLRNVHFVLVFTVFCTSLQGSPGGGQEQPFLRLRFSAFVHLHWFLHCFFALSHFFLSPCAFSFGFYSVFRLHDVAAAMLDICVGGGC